MSESYTGKVRDLDTKLGHMCPSNKLKLYGQLLLTAQRLLITQKYELSEQARKDAEKILMHFEKTID